MSAAKKMAYEGIASDGKKIWYMLFESGILIEIDIDSGKTRTIGRVPGYEGESLAYRYLIQETGILYLLPFKACELAIYDIQKDNFRKVMLPREFCEKYDFPKIVNGVVIDNCLYMFGPNSVILVYDIGLDLFKIIELNDRKYDFWRKIAVIDNFICIAETNTSGITFFDVNKEKIYYHPIEDSGNKVDIQSLAVEKNSLYLLIRNMNNQYKIYFMNEHNVNGRFFELEDVYSRVGYYEVAHISVYNKKVFALPMCSEEAYVYDIRDENMKNVEYIPKQKVKEMENGYPFCCNYVEMCTLDRYIFSIHFWTDTAIMIDMAEGMAREIKLEYDNDYRNEIIKYYREIGNLKENEIYGLKDFLKEIIE